MEEAIKLHSKPTPKSQPLAKELNRCLCCDGENLYPFLCLGKQPLANNYRKDTDQVKFPLEIQVCKDCFHTQLTLAVHPDLLFKNYLYVSGTTETLRNYFDWFAEYTVCDMENVLAKKIHSAIPYAVLRNQLDVLDIAANDCSQLERYKLRGCKVLGIDPAENLKHYADEKEIETICDYWNLNTAFSLAKSGRQFDIITAQNVVAHVSNPYEFLQACSFTLKDHGKLYVQTSQAFMYDRGEYDYFYHEHISSFNINSMKTLAKRAGMVLTNVFYTDIHGGSYIFVIEKSGEPTTLEEEENYKYNVDFYIKFADKANRTAANFVRTIKELRKNGYLLVGTGAAAKSCTFLNFTDSALDYIIDDNALKWDYLMPGVNTPIKDPKVISSEKNPIAFIILAWNFKTEIMQKIMKLRNVNKDKFLTYFPEVIVE